MAGGSGAAGAAAGAGVASWTVASTAAGVEASGDSAASVRLSTSAAGWRGVRLLGVGMRLLALLDRIGDE